MRTELGSADMAALAKEAITLLASLGEDTYDSCEWRRDNMPTAEVAGQTFAYLGEGADRMAVLAPDGIVYKAYKYWGQNCACGCTDAMRKPGWVDSQTEVERELFDMLADAEIPWCPDYCAYGAVTAMPRYTTSHDACRELPREAFEGIYKVTCDPHRRNIGFDADGNPVLIDGGISFAKSLPERIASISTRGNPENRP